MQVLAAGLATRRELSPLEADGGSLGVVLVVGVRCLGCGDDAVEVATERGELRHRGGPLRKQLMLHGRQR